MKSFTDGGGKGKHAVVGGVKKCVSHIDKSNIGGRPSRRSSARKQNFSVQISEKIISTGKGL